MKEFIEKLIGRLEEQKTRYREIRKNTYCRRTEMDDCDSCRADHYLDARLEGINKAKEIVNQLAEEYKGGWIPCSERLPDTEDYVLVNGTGNYEGVFIAYYEQEAEKWRYDTDEGIYYYIDVIAWQPLPELYQEPAAVQKTHKKLKS